VKLDPKGFALIAVAGLALVTTAATRVDAQEHIALPSVNLHAPIIAAERAAGRLSFTMRAVVGMSVLLGACSTSTVDYQQWWYPECKTGDGSFGGGCIAASLAVSDSLCGTFSKVSGGYIPTSYRTAGYACFIRSADGKVIVTEMPPVSTAGLKTCGVVLGGNAPFCPDGAPSEF
jgi:hypothetical protein